MNNDEPELEHSCDVMLEVLAEREYPINGDIKYHDLPLIGEEATRIKTEESLFKVELLRNPNFNYRDTNERMKMIFISLPNQPYEGSIISRGGDNMPSQYEKVCQMAEKGNYTLHLLSNGFVWMDEK